MKRPDVTSRATPSVAGKREALSAGGKRDRSFAAVKRSASSAAEILAALDLAVSSRARIAAAYLYGSTVAGRTTGLSDVDAGARRLLASDIAAELVRALPGRTMDVRDLDDLPLVLQGRVLTEGILAGSNDPVRRVRFETDTRMRYFDFLPFHRADVAEGLKGLRRKRMSARRT